MLHQSLLDIYLMFLICLDAWRTPGDGSRLQLRDWPGSVRAVLRRGVTNRGVSSKGHASVFPNSIPPAGRPLGLRAVSGRLPAALHLYRWHKPLPVIPAGCLCGKEPRREQTLPTARHREKRRPRGPAVRHAPLPACGPQPPGPVSHYGHLLTSAHPSQRPQPGTLLRLQPVST